MKNSRLVKIWNTLRPGLPGDFDARLVALTSVAVLCLYGSELFKFTLSIDEELLSFAPEVWRGWLYQGRWGMALMSAVLPPISAIPFMSTLIFGFGLVLAALNLAALLKMEGEKALIFCLVFVVFPIWPHVAEFNSLSFGVGIGVLAMSIGVRLCTQNGMLSFILSIIFLSFSIAIYQAFAVFIVIVLLFTALLLYDSDTKTERRQFLIRGGLIVFFSSLTYLLIQKATYMVFHIVPSGYVDQLNRVQDYYSTFYPSFKTSVSKSRSYLLGTADIYLRWGRLIVSMPIFGGILYFYQRIRYGLKNALVDLALLVIVLVVAIAPIFVSVGTVPARGLFYLPFMAAVLSSFLVVPSVNRTVIRIWMLMTIFISIYICNVLFYWDYIAREQDQQTAISISQRLDSFRINNDPIPFSVIGALQPQLPVRKIEVFGASFFEWDGGSVNRINAYMQIIGLRGLKPIDVGSLSVDVIKASEKMPMWPAKGAVAWIEDIAVVKLGEMNIQQKTIFCAAHPQTQFCEAGKNGT